jgi:hypothetical protein
MNMTTACCLLPHLLNIQFMLFECCMNMTQACCLLLAAAPAEQTCLGGHAAACVMQDTNWQHQRGSCCTDTTTTCCLLPHLLNTVMPGWSCSGMREPGGSWKMPMVMVGSS